MKKEYFNILFCCVFCVIGCASAKFTPLTENIRSEFPAMKIGDTYIFDDFRLKVVDVEEDGRITLGRYDIRSNDTRSLFLEKGNYLFFDDSRGLKISINFPLFVGKEWRYAYTARMSGYGDLKTLSDHYRVDSFGIITTKAGPIKAFKILINNFKIVYYSSELRMIVKIDSGASSSSELISYRFANEGEVELSAKPGATAVVTNTNVLSSEIRGDDEDVEIDQGLPVNIVKNPNAIAVVIGNKDYTKTRRVDFAVNDAELVKKYLVEALGYREGNIFYIANASQTDFRLYFGDERTHKGKLFNTVKPDVSDVFVYYSGHGAPGLKDRRGYLVPVEADPQYLELSGYPVEVFYKNLAKLPARSITVVLDACFSGAAVFDNVSPMVLTVENPVLDLENGVVLSSSSGTQVSSWYNEKEHGMFTYFFLKAINNMNADHDKDGKLTYDEIFRYVSDSSDGVPYYARRIHGVEQNPTIEGQYKDRVFVRY